MKAKATSLLVVILLSTIHISAQKQITVEAKNNDISDNLDLQALASVFGDSKDLQEFEMKLNDFDSQISNLDLNNDGEVDYLRVIESTEKDVHLVVIQAVLEKDVYQDVASILVQRKENRRTIVQVIGAPYMYGENYIIEPVYVYTPVIYSYFWRSSYSPWLSPYYWGYYPSYYRYRRPCEYGFYVNHIHSHINHNHRYYYTERRRYADYDRFYQTVSRNDYGVRYPDRNFSSRNNNIRNRQEYDNRYNTNNRLLSRPANEVRSRDYSSSERVNGASNSTYNRNNVVRTNNQQTRTISSQSAPRNLNNTEGNNRPQGNVRVENSQRTNSTVERSSRSVAPRSEVRTQSPPARSTSSRTDTGVRTGSSSNGGRR